MACEITVPSVLSDRLVLAGAQPGVQARLAQRHLLVRELDLGAHVREPGREHRAEQREGGPRVAGPREARRAGLCSDARLLRNLVTTVTVKCTEYPRKTL